MRGLDDTGYRFQGKFWDAYYSDQVIPDYVGNPLIETLPPHLGREEAAKQLTYLPEFREERSSWPIEQRQLLLLRAVGFFQPLDVHLQLYDRISAMIRNGYVGRNPLELGYWPEVRRKIRSVREFTPSEEEASKLSGQGMTIMALSGLGKSRGIQQTLTRLPQIIRHRRYHGRPFPLMQLVWLKVEFPHDATLSGVCRAFLVAVDRKLGTRFYEEYAVRGRPSIDTMVHGMATVAALSSLGVLAFDEIQRLRVARSGGAEKVLNFFTALDNDLGVPVVLIGTPDAVPVLSDNLARARRAAGVGDLAWHRMAPGPEWDMFVETLSRYQYLAHPLNRADDGVAYGAVTQALYKESLGITDIVCKLYFLAQTHAMLRHEERLTPEMIKLAARTHLPLLQPFLQAIRSNDVNRLEKLGDLPPIDLKQEIEQLFAPAAPIQLGPQPPGRAANACGGEDPADARAVPDTSGEDPRAGKRQRAPRSKAHVVEEPSGLPGLVRAGAKGDLSPHESLKRAGVARSPLELPEG
jgi:AAA domain